MMIADDMCLNFDDYDQLLFEICDFFFLFLIYSCFFVIHQFWTTEKLILDYF
jgi:hypothetical protein